jgi:hypothetical protein
MPKKSQIPQGTTCLSINGVSKKAVKSLERAIANYAAAYDMPSPKISTYLRTLIENGTLQMWIKMASERNNS